MMFVAVFRLCVFLPYISGLIMPLTKSDGSPDLTSLLGHMTLLEQTVESLHKDTNKLQIDLNATNERLQLTQGDLNVTKQELQTSRIELQATKDKLQHTQTDLQITKNDLQAAQTDLLTNKGLQQSAATEILTLKTDMTALRTDLGLVKSKVETFGPDFHPVSTTSKDSLLVSLNGSVMANQGAIKAIERDVQSVHDDLNTTAHTISEVQSDINSFMQNMSSALRNATGECLALKSDSNLVSALQSDITAMDTKLYFLNITVHEVQKEARQVAANTSSVVQLIAHRQLVENMDTQSLKTLAQDTSSNLNQLEKNVNSTIVSVDSQLKQLATGVNSSSASIHNVQQDLLSLQSDLNTTRAEITVTNSEVHALNSNVQQDLLSLQSDLNTTRADITVTNSEVHALNNNVQQDLLSLHSDLNTTRAEITVTNSEVHALYNNVSAVRKLSAETKQALAQLAKTLATKTKAVAFQAYVSTSKNATSLHPIVYDSTICDIGSVYNKTTGKFTAPVSGTYMFWTEMNIHSSSLIPPATIKQSGRTITSGWLVPTTTYDVTSATCVSHLLKGEEVWVQFERVPFWMLVGPSTVRVLSGRDDTKPNSYFGGALLTAD